MHILCNNLSHVYIIYCNTYTEPGEQHSEQVQLLFCTMETININIARGDDDTTDEDFDDPDDNNNRKTRQKYRNI